MRVTAEARQATREKILQTARTLFRARGYEQTTTRDIARAAQIATGTLFNYFPTKEAIVASVVEEALAAAQQDFDAESHDASSLEELKPFRRYLAPILETTLSPLASAANHPDGEAFRLRHLETVARLVAWHELGEPSPVALQLYWTLYTGVLAFWTQDASPKQEDTLALLDQSLEMFVGWLQSETREGSQKGDQPEE
jgi:AcrR family transcriptional regulator